MIDFTLSSEHEALRETVAAFARDEVAPVIGDYYERNAFPYPLIAAMAKMGLFGLPFPEEYGGMGGDLLAVCLAIEELGRVDSSVAITLEAAVCLGATPVYRFGTEEQKRQWLPALCAGEQLAAFGLTEPGGGTDVPGGMRTTARQDGGEWVISGSKAFITNAGTDITSLITVAAKTGDKEISAFLVPAGQPRSDRRRPPVQGRLVRVGHQGTVLRQRARAGGEPARPAGPRLRPVPEHAGRGPGRDRRAVRGAGPGLCR